MFSKPAPVISADVDVQEETANDETKWNLIDFVSNEVRRRSIPNVLTEQSGLTHCAKRMIDSPLSAFLLLVDKKMLSYIQKCTETEDRKVLKNDFWGGSLIELQAFIALLYGRGVYMMVRMFMLKCSGIEWGFSFFQHTMSRHRF